VDQHDDKDPKRELDTGPEEEGMSHATTGGAAAAGALTGGVIGLAGGPVGAAIGAVGGAILGAAAERMMHSDDDTERARNATQAAEADALEESEVEVEAEPSA
jgi:outer membrane lipoprotein SlyB